MFKYIGQASQERGVAPYSFQPKWGVEAGEEDMVRLLAHRAPEEEYKSIHPPLEEREEPEYVVREMVEPITPRQRAGIEPGILAGRTIARTGRRGRTVHGQRGMMFDVLKRWALDEETGEIRYLPERAISAGGEPHSYLLRAGIKTEEAKTEEPTYEKFEEVISKVPSEIMKEIRERITIYGRSEEVTKSLEKLDIEVFRRGEEGSRHLRNIHDLTSTFKRTGDLKPEKMLRLLESKKYAMEHKKEDLWWVIESEKINKVENEYYKDILPIPKGLKRALREKKEKLSKEEAKKSLKDFMTMAEELKLGEGGKRSFVGLIEEMLITD